MNVHVKTEFACAVPSSTKQSMQMHFDIAAYLAVLCVFTKVWLLGTFA